MPAARCTIPLPPPRDAAIDGVLAFTAPEVLAGAPCSPAADVFSLAATVVELLDGVRVPEPLHRCLEAARDPAPGTRPNAATLRDRAASTAPPPRVGAGAAPEASPSPQSEVLDDDVQFTVYRPHNVQPDRWYMLLAFAHKSEPFVDDLLGSVDPVEEVRRQASARLGEDLARYGSASDDSSQQLPHGSSLTFVPEVHGVEFNPPRRTFMWLEPVHLEDFRLRAEPRLDGQRARGRLSVYFGSVLIAEVSLAFRVSSSGPDAAVGREDSRPYRKIFISYSHRDRAVVEQVETFLSVVGDEFLRDARDLRAGEVWEDRLAEMIREADVFQLFWSTNSMRSPFVQREWTYALALGRPSFIRPTYWEDPLPEVPEQGLPPDELRRLHFRSLLAAIAGQAPPGAPDQAPPPPPEPRSPRRPNRHPPPRRDPVALRLAG
jgi:hypothetical protein